MEIEVNSWSRQSNIPELIGRKKVDWSTFRDGSHIPLDFIQYFKMANGGVHINRGEKHDIILTLEGEEYTGTLLNMDRRNYYNDTLQIRFDSKLKEVLKSKLQKLYDYLLLERDSRQHSGETATIIIPEEYAAYIYFYDTGTPFKYRLELFCAFSGNIWWVNQGKNVLKEKAGQYIWAPLRTQHNQTISHWERLAEVKKEDIIIHYANGAVRFVSKVISSAENMEKPDKNDDEYVDRMGRLIKTDYFALEPPVSLAKISDSLMKLSIDGGPLDVNGGVKQGYLFKFNEAGLNVLQQCQQETEWPEFSRIKTESFVVVEEFELKEKFSLLLTSIASQGYSFEPWQIATYITALRTKPFVILAGVSGTGKTKLPQLVAKATGCKCNLLPVRPDWTDSSEVLGYCDLQGQFRPGTLLSWLKQASDNPKEYYVGIIDEMNLARVEHYFAEILSQIENRHTDPNGGFCSGSLINQALDDADNDWGEQIIPGNFAIIGTVNMDESAYGFSRKVLDRAFTLEFSDINLSNWQAISMIEEETHRWPVSAWYPKATRLNTLQNISDGDKQQIEKVIQALQEINTILTQAQLQVAYRTRDEIALFILQANEIIEYFTTSDGQSVDPLDLALLMKVLPRILGGSAPIRLVVQELLSWAHSGVIMDESEVNHLLERWVVSGRPASFQGIYPRTTARLCLMWERLNKEGFTSFWM